ncbi:hypothetical protein [Undibacterium sp. TJN19]|uniref:hypothetical protein n=1 Tax=Undibacterium sp. TJN19 TaxID=3413055 RepID=UPI003BF15FEC
MEMQSYALPEIDNAEDFFEIIKVLRLNYRQWNQRLSALLWAYSELKDAASRQELADFIKSCPWNMLVDVACDTVEQV